MPDPSQLRRRSALARDGAVRRLRRATQISIATMVALGGGFAALAAGSTHAKTAAVHRTKPSVRAKVVTAPAPPLVGSLDEQPAADAVAGSRRARAELSAACRQLRRLMTDLVSFRALGTTATVVVTESTSLATAAALLRERLEAVDRACSRFRGDSELTWVNAHAGTVVSVSPLLARAIRVALDAARTSAGCVDPTLGSQLRAAGYDRTFSLVRERATWRIVPATSSVGVSWKDVRLADRAPNTVRSRRSRARSRCYGQGAGGRRRRPCDRRLDRNRRSRLVGR